MTTEQKIIRAKVGLVGLAKQLGNVSQACWRTCGQFERAQTIFFLGFVSRPDQRERRVRKLPPDRQVIRCDNNI
jgi:hypothetical protein